MDGKIGSGNDRHIRFYGYAGEAGLSDRIRALDNEWDAEKFTLVALSGVGLFGLLMGLFGSRLWRVFTWASVPLLLLAALGRWRPVGGLISALGLRSRKEKLEEKYALKALRGDFGKADREGDSGYAPRETSEALDEIEV